MDEFFHSRMIAPGESPPEFNLNSPISPPFDSPLVPYSTVCPDKTDAARWNEILTSKYKNDRVFLRSIDSMSMHLILCNMRSMVSSAPPKNEGKVAKRRRMWDAAMKHSINVRMEDEHGERRAVVVNTPTLYSVFEFLIGPASTWKTPERPPPAKKRKHSGVAEEDLVSTEEGDDALAMWTSVIVRRSTPTTLLNLKFTCKKLYALIDWRAVAFAFQRYVHPAFKIPNAAGWDNHAYFRHYVMKNCAVPDFPQLPRGMPSFLALQVLLHRYANYCRERLGVVMLYTRTRKALVRRIFFVNHTPVDIDGTPQIPPLLKQTHPWKGVTHIRRDLVSRDGGIHVEARAGKTPAFCSTPSGWSALEPNVYAIAESQEVFCGTLSKSEIERIGLVESCDSSKKEEEEEEEGEAFDSHDGWMTFGDELAEIEQEIEGEGEYAEELGEEDLQMLSGKRLTRSNAKVPDWLKDEQDAEDAAEHGGDGRKKSKKKKQTKSGGIFVLNRNEIDDLEEEEEFEFKSTKRRKRRED